MYQILQLLDDRADKKRAGFIVLISDGLDGQIKWGDESIAPTDPIRGLLRKYPVHTFGLGKAHDPKALHYIANISYGIYSSITDNLDNKFIEALAVCLAGFKTVAAVDACVDIWSNSLMITRIDPGGYILRGSSGGILVGTLYAGEVKDFIVHFSYRTGSWSGGYYTTLNGINARATYKEAPGRQSITSTLARCRSQFTWPTLISSCKPLPSLPHGPAADGPVQGARLAYERSERIPGPEGGGC
jgi:hypothetical protein